MEGFFNGPVVGSLKHIDHSFIINREATFFNFCNNIPGTCWHPCVEKDAQVNIDQRHKIQFKGELLDLFNKFKKEHPITKEDIDLPFPHLENYLPKGKDPEEFMKEQTQTVRFLESIKIADIPCTCKGEQSIGAVTILPVAENTKKPVIYNNCARTLFSSFKRQLKLVPSPTVDVVNGFQQYCDQYFERYLAEPLNAFEYSFAEWFNHNPAKKQRDLLENMPIEMLQEIQPRINKPQIIDKYIERARPMAYYISRLRQYTLFPKSEVQEEGGKTRAISGIDTFVKLVMGPICWKLEEIFTKYAPGYCGNKNWQQLEDWLDNKYLLGFQTVLQGDGSGFDLTQSAEMKYIDRKIYDYLYQHGKINHVDGDLFRIAATATIKELIVKQFIERGVNNLAKAEIYGTVFSGSSDTTLMNTLRMAMYNMFTLEKNSYHPLKYKEDFDLKAKGDDFMVLVRDPDLDYNRMYNQYWCTKKQAEDRNFCEQGYGVGQILKFLNVGGFETIDFCSTTVIPYKNHTHFKIARKPDRMVFLSHYSRKAKTMTAGELKQYYLDLADQIEKSMPGMPFYTSYANAFKHHASLIKAQPKRVGSGTPRLFIYKEEDGSFTRGLTEEEKAAIEYGFEYYYKFMTRQSSHKIEDSSVLNHLLYRYHITPQMIEEHERFLKYGGYYDYLSDNMVIPE